MTKEPIGSVAEEAAKLFAVLQQAAHTQTPPTADARTTSAADARTTSSDDVGLDDVHEDVPGPDDAHEHGIGRGPECQWCPVCQLINKVRHTSPETIEQLSSAAAHVLGSVRSLLEAAAEAARQAREDAESRSPERAAQQEEPTRSRVDRIDVSEDPEPWD
ncbi:hypothetical protein EV652_101108 [Kribbella steppae]|uniref:Uncharacterized protein n=1 Tax=Kribbella steppae TaxID=2512223 RepID=A0A4R2HVY1_9ACTN|nr:hypothetical protein [Kribbella steppae]TCO35229.1 hypothetical protein EV652_101108 [Kribbella steppae]